jgi:plasmid stabilization system protein ParE
MKLLFDARAVEDLESIHQFIAADNPHAARAVTDRIVASIGRLVQFPEMGRTGTVVGTREWVIPRLPYIAVYRTAPDRDAVIIVGVFHGARDRGSE